MQKRNGKHDGLITALLALIGISILLYPTASDLWNRWRDQRLMTEYDRSTLALSDEESGEVLKQAAEYNAQHTVNTICDAFEGDGYSADAYYESLLDLNGNGLMGSLEIPKIGQRLPIYHGIGAEALEQGVGHVEGTSLPIGGASTHAVLAGHRGLPGKKLFTDLDQLEPGDQFYIHILDEVLAYEIDQIVTVLPEETQELSIHPGGDYVTLLTCTPYGVNTHRLLVRGARTAYVEERREEQAAQMDPVETIRDLPLKALGVGLFALIVILPCVRALAAHKKQRRRAEKNPRHRPARRIGAHERQE